MFVVSDPRVNDWAMMSSPLPTLGICLFYAYFSKVLGPRLMENRKPFDLRRILIGYNLIQTVFSSWIFYEVSTFYITVTVRGLGDLAVSAVGETCVSVLGK